MEEAAGSHVFLGSGQYRGSAVSTGDDGHGSDCPGEVDRSCHLTYKGKKKKNHTPFFLSPFPAVMLDF